MERQKPTPQMIAQVNVLTADLSSDKKKVRVLYKHLQQKVRYVSVQIGIGGFQPMAADQVEQLGYGDCKALVNYMQSLLSVAGISSYYCVVNAGDIKRDMDASFASMNQGNHVILAVPLEQDIVWLECTSQQVPFGFLGSFTADRIVFACTEEGGKLLRTPGFAAEENLQKREGRFVLDKEGDVKGPLSTSFYGNQFDNRFAVLGLPSIEQEKQLKEIYHVDNIAFKNITYVQKEAHDLQLNERFNIEVRRYAPKSGKRIYLIPNLFNRRAAVPTTQERTMPLFLNSGYKDVDSLVFTFPKDYRVDLKPSNIELDTEFGSFTMRLYVEGNDLFFYRALILHEGQFAPEKYLAFAQFINAVYQADLGKVVFLEQL
ncbi:hypothetical protein [Olivibacter sp. XZL3]|uniref:hypothetical protein n=1 Tax=Olivibacter sp. XZL3 TaxID=1735116 RepID=UPI00106571EE|nr:hypothetical protein [Olivibacter sp. XZL3]